MNGLFCNLRTKTTIINRTQSCKYFCLRGSIFSRANKLPMHNRHRNVLGSQTESPIVSDMVVFLLHKKICEEADILLYVCFFVLVLQMCRVAYF